MSSLAACLLAAALAAPVAHLRVATKDVKVFHGKAAQPASKDLPLELADEVEVPVGGFALVQIDRNQQLVRIDEDLRLAVRDLAALEAPKTTVTLEDQVNALLTSTENTPVGAERMVGWYVTPTAAQVRTSAGFLKKDAEGPKAKSINKLEEDLGGNPTRERRAGGGAAAAPGGGAVVGGKQNPVPQGVVSDEAPANRAPSPPPPSPAAEPVPETKAPAPAKPSPAIQPVAGPQQPDEATRACLRDALQRLGESAFRRIGPTVTVKLRKGDHRVVVFLEGAVPVDACVQTWAERQAAFLPDQGWAVLEVPLK